MDSFKDQISRCIEILKTGGTIVYPTGTIWALGCDATNIEAVEKVKTLKGSMNDPMLCLVNNQALLERYLTQIPDLAYDIMDVAVKPTSLVFDSPKDIATNCCHQDGSIGIRVAHTKFCRYLIGAFKKPIVATTANYNKSPYPTNLSNVPKQILESVDYVVNLQIQKNTGVPSTIIKLGNNGVVRIIRK